MLLTFCPSCGAQHDLPGDCPDELRPTGPERHGWAVAVDATRGVELYGVVLAPAGARWRARIVTYPRSPWTVPGGCSPLKFFGETPGEAETRALRFVLDWCAERNRSPRDGFGPWDEPEGPAPRRPLPRKRRSHPVRYGAGGKMNLSTTANLSAGGMFLITPRPLPEETVLDIETEIYDCVAHLRGIVAWKRERLEPGHPRGMGIRLLDPPPVYKLFVRESM
jgi:hypothetical protein